MVGRAGTPRRGACKPCLWSPEGPLDALQLEDDGPEAVGAARYHGAPLPHPREVAAHGQVGHVPLDVGPRPAAEAWGHGHPLGDELHAHLHGLAAWPGSPAGVPPEDLRVKTFLTTVILASWMAIIARVPFVGRANQRFYVSRRYLLGPSKHRFSTKKA